MTQLPEDSMPNVQDPEYLARRTDDELVDIARRATQSIDNLNEYRDRVYTEISRRENQA